MGRAFRVGMPQFEEGQEPRRAGGAPAIVFFSESQHRGTHLNGRVEEHAATDALHNLFRTKAGGNGKGKLGSGGRTGGSDDVAVFDHIGIIVIDGIAKVLFHAGIDGGMTTGQDARSGKCHGSGTDGGNDFTQEGVLLQRNAKHDAVFKGEGAGHSAGQHHRTALNNVVFSEETVRLGEDAVGTGHDAAARHTERHDFESATAKDVNCLESFGFFKTVSKK